MVLQTIDGATTNEIDPSVTADGLTMYLASFKTGSNDIDVLVSTRTSTAADFSTPSPVSTVNSTAAEHGPYVIPDGRALYFSRSSVGVPTEVAGLNMGSGRMSSPW